MPSQPQVEGFERELRQLTLAYECERDRTQAAPYSESQQMALAILWDEFKHERMLCAIEWGL